MTPRFRPLWLVLLLVLLLAACSDDGGQQLTAAAGDDPAPSSTSASSTTSTTTTLVPPTTAPPETTAPPVETTRPRVRSTAPPTEPPPETTPPTTVPVTPDTPTDFTLELDGTTTVGCPEGHATCWNVKATWRGGPWWYNLTPSTIEIAIQRITTLPIGPNDYPIEGDRYVVSFRMQPSAHDCPLLRAIAPIPNGGIITPEMRSEAVQACIDTPAL